MYIIVIVRFFNFDSNGWWICLRSVVSLYAFYEPNEPLNEQTIFIWYPQKMSYCLFGIPIPWLIGWMIGVKLPHWWKVICKLLRDQQSALKGRGSWCSVYYFNKSWKHLSQIRVASFRCNVFGVTYINNQIILMSLKAFKKQWQWSKSTHDVHGAWTSKSGTDAWLNPGPSVSKLTALTTEPSHLLKMLSEKRRPSRCYMN